MAFKDNEFERDANNLYKGRSSADLPGTRRQLQAGPLNSTLPGNDTPGPSKGAIRLHETQTQTVQGDDPTSSEDYDSNHNNDAIQNLRRITQRKKKSRQAGLAPNLTPTVETSPAKGKSRQVKSRFSLGRKGDELHIYDISTHEQVVALTCDDNTFLTSVTEHPTMWIDSIRESLNEILRLRAEVRDVTDQQITTAVELGTSKARNTALGEDLQRANTEADRLRRRRNAYQAENVALTDELENLKEQVQTLSHERQRATNDDYDSNDGRLLRQRRIPATQSGIPVTQSGADAPSFRHMMKTRDTPIFSGDGDRDTYDA